MKRLVLARVLITVVGVLVWAYGFRANDANVRLAGIVLVAISPALRFVPKRWLAREPERERDEP